VKRLPLLLLLLALPCLVGCNFWRLYGDRLDDVGTEQLSAGGTRASLPVDVPTAAAAFAEALPAHGYTLSHRQVDIGAATLIGVAGDRRVKVNLRVQESGSSAVISVGPFVDDAVSERLLRSARSRLGLP
jgi:hypothetical protein